MSDFEIEHLRDVRSAAGHAAFSMKGTDDRWVQIQLNTFTNWVNEQLLDTNSRVDQLIGDLCDGIKLCYLLEGLQGRKIGRFIKKPMNQHHYLENVNLAIRAMMNDNIKLVNIGQYKYKVNIGQYKYKIQETTEKH
jgi:filamin